MKENKLRLKLVILKMLDDAESINEVIKNYSYAQFEIEPYLFDSTMYNFIKLGEAVSLIPTDFQEKYNVIRWVGIKGFRNVAVHAYLEIDKEKVWETALNDIPPLIQQLKEIINSEGFRIGAEEDA